MDHHHNATQQQLNDIVLLAGVSNMDDNNETFLVLPDEIYAAIASFVPDVPSVGRCAAVCKAFYTAINRSENNMLWYNLANKQWKIVPLLENPSATNGTSTYMPMFRRRHRLDVAVSNVITELAMRLMNAVNTEQPLESNWGNREMVFLGLFAETSIDSYEPYEALDALVRIIQHSEPLPTTASNDNHAVVSTIHPQLAHSVFDTMYFAQIYWDWIQMLWTTDSGDGALSQLECGVILVEKHIILSERALGGDI